jgi:prophage regulatory protein
MTQRLLRLPKVCDRTGYKRDAIYKLVRAGKFPQPVKLPGGRASAWVETEIDAVVTDAIAARDGKTVRP